MGALPRHIESPLLSANWQPDLVQRMDESHLVAFSDRPESRLQFAGALGQFLGMQADVEVCILHGRFITDLSTFCDQLEHALPGPTLERRIDGPRGVVSLLRERPAQRRRRAAKYRYYLWHDAEVLLRRDPRLFGRLVDALAGVAAEAEYVSDELLLIHRAVFVGGSILDIYADDPAAQFQSWHKDEYGEPFWEVVTGIPAPPFARCRIDELVA